MKLLELHIINFYPSHLDPDSTWLDVSRIESDREKFFATKNQMFQRSNLGTFQEFLNSDEQCRSLFKSVCLHLRTRDIAALSSAAVLIVGGVFMKLARFDSTGRWQEQVRYETALKHTVMATATHVPARALHQPREGWLSSVAGFFAGETTSCGFRFFKSWCLQWVFQVLTGLLGRF